MKIALSPLEKITPYERNPRNSDAAVDAVAESIKEFGFRQPIVVDEQNVIIAGHARYFAAIRLGLEKVPVHVAKDLTPDQVLPIAWPTTSRLSWRTGTKTYWHRISWP